MKKSDEALRAIQEAMARVDGYEFRGACWFRGEIMISRGVGLLPAYPTSHDAVQRVVDGLNKLELDRYCSELMRLTGYTPFGIVKATALQKCEAILKALGKWTKEME